MDMFIKLGMLIVFFGVMVVATLFMLCVVFLVLKVCFNIDLSTRLKPIFETIMAS